MIFSFPPLGTSSSRTITTLGLCVLNLDEYHVFLATSEGSSKLCVMLLEWREEETEGKKQLGRIEGRYNIAKPYFIVYSFLPLSATFHLSDYAFQLGILNRNRSDVSLSL